MKPRSLYTIDIEVNDVGDGHHEITILLPVIDEATDPATTHLYNNVTNGELWQAAEAGAGLLARLAMWAAPYAEQERARHKCSGHRIDEYSDNPLIPPLHLRRVRRREVDDYPSPRQ